MHSQLGPPRINMVGATHTPFAARQKLLMMIYDQRVLLSMPCGILIT